MRIEKHGDRIHVYIDNKLIATMSLGEWSRMISLPGTTVSVGVMAAI